MEKSRQEHVQSTARLEAFRRQLADAAETARARAAVELPKPSAPPTPDNPQWLDLNRQLAALQQRYDQLLADRTPLHPSVQELAGRMAGVKNQLATTPRQVPNTAPHVPDAPDMAASITPDPAVSRADQQTLDNLTAAVERTHRACEEAKSVEKKVLAAQQAGPQFAIEHAQVVENRPEPDYAWRRLILTTFAAGLVMAFGVGFVSIGSDVEPRAASAAEVLAAAGAPWSALSPPTIPCLIPLPPAVINRVSAVCWWQSV